MQESSDVPLVRCLGSYLFEGKADAYCIVKKTVKKADYTVSEAIQKVGIIHLFNDQWHILKKI